MILCQTLVKISVDQRSGANLKKHVFCKMLLQISGFFSFSAQKTLKITILTSVWTAQHPNAGQNIYNTCETGSLFRGGRVGAQNIFGADRQTNKQTGLAHLTLIETKGRSDY